MKVYGDRQLIGLEQWVSKCLYNDHKELNTFVYGIDMAMSRETYMTSMELNFPDFSRKRTFLLFRFHWKRQGRARGQ